METPRARSLVTRLIAVPTTVAVSLTPASAAPPPDIRVVALSGQPAPGTPAGTRFSFFGAAEFDGAPGIGADSTFGFAAVLSDGTAGFWLDHGSGPELLARTGDHAPGTETGVVFSQRIAEVIIFTPPLLVPGHAVLRNSLSGPGVGFNNDDGLWSSSGSGLVLAVREGAPAPGIQGVQISTMNLQGLDDAGRAVFSALLTGAVVDGNNESIWRAAPDTGLELLAREGSAAPGTGPGVVFAAPAGPSAFPIIMGNAAGDLLFQGNLHGPGTSSANDEALFIRDASGTRLLTRESDPVPGMPGFVFEDGATAGFQFSNISFGDDGHVAVAVRVAGSSERVSALLSDTAGALATLVRSGDPAPGTSERFDLLLNPVMNLRGDIAFLGSTTPGSAFPSLGLRVHSSGGARAVALPGQLVPGQPDAATFQSVQLIQAFNNDGFLLFTALLSAPGGQSGTALLLANPVGEISVLARTGATLAIGNGVVRTISQVFARSRALSDDGHAAFAAQFTDGSSAQLVATVAGTASCYPNCDGSTAAPVLNVQDFSCFLNRFAAGDSYANCDGSAAPPVLNIADFSCFLNAFAAGCP
jgi:hypothetical protein